MAVAVPVPQPVGAGLHHPPAHASHGEAEQGRHEQALVEGGEERAEGRPQPEECFVRPESTIKRREREMEGRGTRETECD